MGGKQKSFIGSRLKLDSENKKDDSERQHLVDKMLDNEINQTKINKELQKDMDTSTGTGTGTNTDTLPVTDTSTVTDTNTSTSTGIDTVTNTDTDTVTNDSLLDSMLDNKEKYVRCVCYLTADQAKFIKDTTKILVKKNKGKKVTESELYRKAIDMLMDAVNTSK